MKSPRKGAKRRWLLSAAAAAVVMTGILALFRAPGGSVADGPERRAPNVTITPGKPDELAMRDLAPLFLPTSLNATPPELRPAPPGGSYFDRDEPRFVFGNLTLPMPSPVAVPASPVEALADTSGPLALGMGRGDAQPPVQPPKGAHLDVFAQEGGSAVLRVALDPSARPRAGGKGASGWPPIEFTAAVNGAGLIGPLVVARGSGVEEIDQHFRNYLARVYRVGDRLPPGFYRIVVGP